MKNLFVIHASIWDMIILTAIGTFAIFYFIVWAFEALRQARKK